MVIEQVAADSGVNFCKTFKVFHKYFHQIFNGDWITSVCACTSDRKRSTRTSFTRMNNPVLDQVPVQVSMWMRPAVTIGQIDVIVEWHLGASRHSLSSFSGVLSTRIYRNLYSLVDYFCNWVLDKLF